jgi:hypothetical protein
VFCFSVRDLACDPMKTCIDPDPLVSSLEGTLQMT